MLLPIQSKGVRRDASALPLHRGVEASARKCGACTELKWPNGTGTGACVRDCCVSVAKGKGWETVCQFESCSCPINVGGINWFRWLVF
jgi:hypothetical protein